MGFGQAIGSLVGNAAIVTGLALAVVVGVVVFSKEPVKEVENSDAWKGAADLAASIPGVSAPQRNADVIRGVSELTDAIMTHYDYDGDGSIERFQGEAFRNIDYTTGSGKHVEYTPSIWQKEASDAGIDNNLSQKSYFDSILMSMEMKRSSVSDMSQWETGEYRAFDSVYTLATFADRGGYNDGASSRSEIYARVASYDGDGDGQLSDAELKDFRHWNNLFKAAE